MKLNLESSSYAFELDEADAPAVLGRSEECNCVITEGNVSRKHAEVNCEKGNWTITDIGSKAGTLVNGKKFEGAMSLSNGDVVRLGDQSFVVTLTDSNDMEALGARLAGGNVRSLLKQAAAPRKPKEAAKKAGASANGKVRSDAQTEINIPKPPKKDAAAADEAADEDAGEEKTSKAEVKPAKRSMKTPAKKKSSAAGMITVLVLIAVAGVGGYFGWNYYQEQQKLKAAATTKTTDGPPATNVNLPPKENAVTLPPKNTATEVAPTEAPKKRLLRPQRRLQPLKTPAPKAETPKTDAAPAADK